MIKFFTIFAQITVILRVIEVRKTEATPEKRPEIAKNSYERKFKEYAGRCRRTGDL